MGNSNHKDWKEEDVFVREEKVIPILVPRSSVCRGGGPRNDDAPIRMLFLGLMPIATYSSDSADDFDEQA